MRIKLIAFLSVAAITYGQVAVAEDEIVGKFAGSFKANNNVLNIALDCKSQIECVLHWNNAETKMSSVKAFPQFAVAKTALECARRLDSKQITDPQTLSLHSVLSPMLTSGATFEKCWDLNNPTPTYTLACVADRAPFQASSLFLLIADPWSRGVGSCGYMIFSLKKNG